jgi:hypothetical protein
MSSESEHLVPADKALSLRAIVCAAALAAVLSASCVESPPAGPTVTLIPSDAIAAVVVESPYKLYKAADEFWKAAGLDKTLGSDLQDLLEKSVPSSGQAQAALDFARPWAMAVLPASGPARSPADAKADGKKTRVLLYVPFRSAPEDIVDKLFGKGALKLVAKAKGYVVLSDTEGQVSFPPAKGADLSRLTRYADSSVKLWGDPSAIRRATADGYKPIAEAVRRFVTDPAETAKADPAAATRALGELGLSFLSQLGLADASIEAGSAGLTLRFGASAASGSELQKTLSTASLAPSALDWASQVSAGSLYGIAWSMDPALFSGLYQRMTDSLLASLGLPGDITAKAAALQAKWSKAAGPRGAMSLDLDVDAAAMAGAKDLKSDEPGAVADFIKKAVRIKFDMLQDIKDEAAYRTLLKGFASDPDYLAFSKAYADAFGLSLAIKSQEKKDGAFSYGEFGIKLKIVDGGKLDSFGGGSSSKAATEAALGALESLASARWSISSGRFVATNGELPALKALAARKAADKSLAAEGAFAAFAKTMPPKTLLVGSLSMGKLMALAGAIAEAAGPGAKASMPDPSLFSSWYSYFAVDARGKAPGLEAGFLIPASDLGALARVGGALFKSQSPSNGGV